MLTPFTVYKIMIPCFNTFAKLFFEHTFVFFVKGRGASSWAKLAIKQKKEPQIRLNA